MGTSDTTSVCICRALLAATPLWVGTSVHQDVFSMSSSREPPGMQVSMQAGMRLQKLHPVATATSCLCLGLRSSLCHLHPWLEQPPYLKLTSCPFPGTTWPQGLWRSR